MRGKKGARSVPPQPPPLSGGEMVALRRVRVYTRAVRGAKSEILDQDGSCTFTFAASELRKLFTKRPPQPARTQSL